MNSRIMLLVGGRTYRAQSFVQAAHKMGLTVIKAIDLPQDLADFYNPTLPLEFGKVDESAQKVIDYCRSNPIRAILSPDDDATVIAALAAEELDLTNNSPDAAYAAKNKALMRRRLAALHVPQPKFELFAVDCDIKEIENRITYPCVLKPILLSASQGVIRANNALEFTNAWNTTKEIVLRYQPPIGCPPSPMGNDDSGIPRILIEEYIPGVEVALEGLLAGGKLQVLALFDKPDPLEGPYFEETIYITPSRLPLATQDAICDTSARACASIGLRDGPIHAELRVNNTGVFVIEVAGRSIGGLCSKALRFKAQADWMSLEEVILRHAVGEDLKGIQREDQASGVMMIPIPEAGILKKVEGIELARGVPLIEEIIISIPPNHPVIKLPYGNQYLGFIFARGPGPEQVERAIRAAHSQLSFEISPHFRLTAI